MKSSYKGMTYQGIDGDPIDLPESISAGFGEDSEAEINSAFSEIVRKTVQNGLSQCHSERLTFFLTRYRDIFRIKLGKDPPAKVQPLLAHPVQNARLYRSPQHRYGQPQRIFISRTVRN